MKIALYSESPDPGPGGAEQFVAVLAEALSGKHEICIVHHKESLTSKSLEEYSGCDLSRVALRYRAPQRDESHRCRTPWTRYREATAWRRGLSEGSDVFIALLHNKAPFCRAGTGVLVNLFPTYDPFRHLAERPATSAPKPSKKSKKPGKKPKRVSKKPTEDGRAGLFGWRGLHRWYCSWEWRRRMATYQVKFSISEFSRAWTKSRWQIESELLYPPVRLECGASQAKQDLILSVGRFATTGHTKKQLEMLAAFREISPSLPSGWRYSCVGGLNGTPNDIAYFDEANSMCEPDLVDVQANIERGQLQILYARASIFWHAAGYKDDNANPELAEHFGLTTVEAMAAGSVPVVINKGGQPEIVEHGVSGFVWDTLDELKAYTHRLALDPELRKQMSAAARARAMRFSREACIDRLARSLGLEHSDSSADPRHS